jgi:hypothetical protein
VAFAAEGDPPPDPVSDPTPVDTGKPSKRDARVKLQVRGLNDGRLRFGERITAVARLSPALSGEPITFSLLRGDRRVGRRTVSVSSSGVARWNLGPYKPGAYRIRAEHPRTARMASETQRSRRFGISYSSLAQGNYGRDVAIFNRHLRKLAFATPGGRTFSEATGRAVLAYRKANGMDRTELATTGIVKRVLRGKGRVKLRHPGAGRHVEGDIGRQILILADDGKPVEVYHTSSGASATPTILGRYRFYSKTPGFNSKGMYYSSYFIRGYAIHGYKSVPTYPASHGCLRIPIPDAIHVYTWVDIGMPIYTYR